MKKYFFSIPLAITLATSSCYAVGTEEVLLADLLANSTEQIKKFNDTIKLATDTLDQIDKVNKTLDSVDHLIFESGEKIFNPKQSIEKIIRKMHALKERFEAYPEKFKNGFGYDRFFKDYHAITCKNEWSGKEMEEFKKIEKQTSIKIEELKVRRCIEENLTKAKTEAQKEALHNVQECMKNNDYECALKELETLRKENISRDLSQNTEVMNSARVLNDVFMQYNSANADGKKEMEMVRENIKNIAKELAQNRTPDLQESISNLNALMIEVVKLTEKQYTAQVTFYKAWNDLQIALYGKQGLTPEEIEKIKKEGLNSTTEAFYKDFIENPKVKYDSLGLPVFK